MRRPVRKILKLLEGKNVPLPQEGIKIEIVKVNLLNKKTIRFLTCIKEKKNISVLFPASRYEEVYWRIPRRVRRGICSIREVSPSPWYRGRERRNLYRTLEGTTITVEDY